MPPIYAPYPPQSPHLALQAAARPLLGVLRSILAGARRLVGAPVPTLRNVDAVDGLDEAVLRDIGAHAWRARREVERERAATQWRIDSGFG